MTDLICTRCGRSAPPDAFHACARMRSGRQSWCKQCAVERTRQWRADNRDAINARRRAEYAATHEPSVTGRPRLATARSP